MATADYDDSIEARNVLTSHLKAGHSISDLTVHPLLIDERRRFNEAVFGVDETLSLLNFFKSSLPLRRDNS